MLPLEQFYNLITSFQNARGILPPIKAARALYEYIGRHFDEICAEYYTVVPLLDRVSDQLKDIDDLLAVVTVREDRLFIISTYEFMFAIRHKLELSQG